MSRPDRTEFYGPFGHKIVINMAHVRTFKHTDGSWWTVWRKGKVYKMLPALIFG